MPAGGTLSVYVHVPFCRELCLYCGCHTKATRRSAPLDAYRKTLESEIALVGAQASARKVSHLHWGGGTPSLLGSPALAEVVSCLAVAFDLSALCEHAIELDPRYVTQSLAHGLSALGINRASLGVQDFSAHVQQAIGRIQPYDLVARATKILRESGIANLNFDLMYGLPHQRVNDARRSAVLAAALRPRRGYAHVPWFRTQQRLIDAGSLPDASERLDQMDAVRAVFIASGYVPVGLDHFAVPDDPLAIAAGAGRLHRNFQGYVTEESSALIGFGASAIGRLPEGFVQNATDVGTYRRAIGAAELATTRGVAMSSDDRLRGAIIERVMCDLAAAPVAIAAQMGANEQFGCEFQRLEPLISAGLVRRTGNRLVVQETGRPFARVVAAAFDS
jgi:oxygen-independent coproporphyrinogen-3 oxidase